MEGEFLMAMESIIITAPEWSSLFVPPVKQVIISRIGDSIRCSIAR